MEIIPFLEKYVPDYHEKKYLLAVSGGVDSMVLLYLFANTKLYFEVCHVNFQLRGKESDEDEKFVVDSCNKFGILVHVIKANTKLYAKQNQLSKQEAARAIRYQAFQNLCNQNHLNYIVTAHHLNDFTENLLYSFIKSSYHHVIENLPPIHQNIIRPLIYYKKQDILYFAALKKVSFREDSSNLLNDYSRNKIRNQVIPVLKEIQPRLETFLLKKWNNYEKKERFIYQHLQNLYLNSVHEIHPKIRIWKPDPTLNSDTTLLFIQFLIDHIFHLKLLSDQQIMYVLQYSQKGRMLVDKEWSILKEKKALSFVHQSILEYSEEIIVHAPQNTYSWNIFTLTLKNTYQYPITIRKWKSGDVFKNQKLSNYFTKKQYPAWLKKIAYVIESPTKKILDICPLFTTFLS